MRARSPAILLLEANGRHRAAIGFLMAVTGMSVRLAMSGREAAVSAVMVDGSQADMNSPEIVSKVRQRSNAAAIIRTSDPMTCAGTANEAGWRMRIVHLSLAVCRKVAAP